MKIYVEGGGNQKLLLAECRKAFRTFLERAGVKRGSFEIVASGSRLEAYKDFKNALKDGENDAILLVDSEELVAVERATEKPINPWQHVLSREGDKWPQPANATDKQLHFMVACMEGWFLADPSALTEYYEGPFKRESFNSSALRGQLDIEKLSKPDVKTILANATRNNKKKGEYNDKSKGAHSFKILETIDPQKVAKASYHVRRLLCHLQVQQAWLDCAPFNDN
jgi:hypothetical protein